MTQLLQWVLKTFIVLLGVLAAEAVKRIFRVLRRNRSLRRQFPGPKSTSLLLGNLAECSWVRQRHRSILDWTNRFGLMYHVRLAWIDAVVISDPAVAAEVLHSRNFDKVPEVYVSVAKMMSDKGHPDLLSGMTDEWWRLFRKGLAPAFNPSNIRAGFKCTYNACTELISVLQRLGPDEAVDMDQACLCETMDVISSFAFGADAGSVKKFGRGEMAELMHVMHSAELEVERRVSDPLREWTWWMTSEGRAAFGQFAHFQVMMKKILADMRARLGQDPPESDNSLGAHMLRLRDPKTGQPLPDARLLPHIGMFFFAGHDTTGHTMSWTLFFIATHPEVEAKVVEELAAAGLLASPQNPNPRAITHDDLADLTYLGAALKESIRMNTVPGTVTIRESKEDCTLGGGKYFMPAGTCFWTPLYTMHNADVLWAESTKFLPERWLEPGADYQQDPATAGAAFTGSIGAAVNGKNGAVNGKHEAALNDDGGACNGQPEEGQNGKGAGGGNNGADGKQASSGRARGFEMNISRGKDAAKVKRFIPFSDGRRDCIGQSLAKMNYTAVLAMLLSRFHFELAPEMGGYEGVRGAEHMAMTLQPGGGLKFLVQRREAIHAA